MDETQATLTVKNVKSEDAGNYSAKLVNEAGAVSSNKASLTVNSTLFTANQFSFCCCVPSPILQFFKTN